MSELRLVEPAMQYESAVMSFRKEFLDAGERVSGGAGLEQAENYEDWLCGRCAPHYGKVSEKVFLAFNDQGILVGISDLRLGTNDFIEKYAGRVGYSVRPSQRGKGYATEILRLTLKEAVKCGFHQVLITCNAPNAASAKVIEKNGGELESTVPHPGFPDVRRYHIALDQ